MEELQRLTTELEQSTYQLSELLYQQATASDGAGAGETSGEHEAEQPHHEDDTVDTEFKA